MDNMENILLEVSEDLNKVMGEARILSIQFRHGFIDYTHMFIAALSIDCAAREYCTGFESEKWKIWLQNYYPATGKETMNDSLPLTLFAERIIRQSYGFVFKKGDASLNSVHLLLALLCIKCDLTEAVSKTGVIFEDVAEQYCRKPVKRSYPSIPLSHKGAYTKWQQFFISTNARKKKVARHYDEAFKLSMYQLYDDSLLACEAGLNLEPDHIDLMELQVLCFAWKRDFQNALTYANKVTGDRARSENFKFTVGYIYDELGQYEEAAKTYDEILANNPLEITTLNNRGFNLLRQGKYTEAIPYFEKVISINPTYSYSWNNLGFAKYKLDGNIRESLELINTSLEHHKGNSYAYKHKGIIYLEQNDKEKALQNFQLALRYGYTMKFGNEVLELLKRIN